MLGYVMLGLALVHQRVRVLLLGQLRLHLYMICRVGTRETRIGASGPRHRIILAIALRAKSARGSLARVQSLR